MPLGNMLKTFLTVPKKKKPSNHGIKLQSTKSTLNRGLYKVQQEAGTMEKSLSRREHSA
jgi:hypothetical protein